MTSGDVAAWVGAVSGLLALGWNMITTLKERPKAKVSLKRGFSPLAYPKGRMLGWEVHVEARSTAVQVVHVQLDVEPNENSVKFSGPKVPCTIAPHHLEHWTWLLPSGRAARGLRVRTAVQLGNGKVKVGRWVTFSAEQLIYGRQHEADGTPSPTRVQVLRDAGEDV